MIRSFRAGVACLGLVVLLPAIAQAAGPPRFSVEGQALQPAGTVQALPAFTVVLGADYSVDDNVKLTIAGATVGGATSTNLNNAANIVCNGGPAIIVSFVTRTGNDIFLRVTQKNVLNTVGVQCTIAGMELTSASLVTPGTVTAAWHATTALTNIPFDPKAAFAVATVEAQLRADTLLNARGIVDVGAPSYRTRFVLPGRDNIATNLFYTGTASYVGPAVQVDTVSVTLHGDFSHVDTNGDGDCSNDAVAGFLTAYVDPAVGVAPTVAADCRSMSASAAANVPTVATLLFWGDFSIGPNPPRKLVAPQSFRVTRRETYSIGALQGERVDELQVGGWTLNGFQAFVDYMPYGANLSQIIYLANKGAQTGEIQVDARNEAGAACSFAAGTAGATRVQVLSGAIQSGLEGCYGAGFTGKVQFTLTAAIPQSEAELYTGYTVNGTDRPVVVNSSNGR